MPPPDLYRIMPAYARDHIDALPEMEREEAQQLIAAGQYRFDTYIRYEGPWEETGIRYVMDLLPADGRVLRVADVHSRQLQVADDRLLDALDEGVPDDPSALP